MSGANALLISPAARDALQSWLDHQRALKGAAENTITAYQGDLVDFLAFMTL
ncbi:MAG TPA: recombinase XerC, partial [Sulfitobacter sp.]|nr:recombinase XerC [Sulfitobacter sp.]